MQNRFAEYLRYLRNICGYMNNCNIAEYLRYLRNICGYADNFRICRLLIAICNKNPQYRKFKKLITASSLTEKMVLVYRSLLP